MSGSSNPEELEPISAPVARPRAMTRLRNYFLTGLIIAGPLGITAYLTWSIIQWVDGWIKPLIPHVYNPDTYLPIPVPGVGLIVAFLALVVIGFLTANIAGKTLLSYGELLLGRMPVVRNLYSGLKQIFETVLAERSNSFKKAAIIQYPRPGLWAIVFIATDARGEVAHRLDAEGADVTAVFLPTTPNPTSGFLLYVPKSEIIELDMTVEEAAKLVISAGLVSPEYEALAPSLPKMSEPQPAVTDA
ncbi:DUF502 domain-containing protein [Stappia sp. 28M-7]|nr:DUF502 domain-containing protein [Stappia sp. 28M-7]